jgi:hypothetical protein
MKTSFNKFAQVRFSLTLKTYQNRQILNNLLNNFTIYHIRAIHLIILSNINKNYQKYKLNIIKFTICLLNLGIRYIN